MKVLIEGYSYVLDNFENKNAFGQKLQFIEKIAVSKDSTEVITLQDGTTNEEIIEVLINRMRYLQSKLPCRENVIVIENLQSSLYMLNKRTSDRQKRNVEGKNEK